MNILIAIILGLVQGLCEFLPVSSSGHLVLLQNVFGVEENSLFFTIMLHAGTLVAVVVAYRAQLWGMIKAFFASFGLLFKGEWQRLRAHVRTDEMKKIWLLILATLVTVAMALVFRDVIDDSYEGKYLGFGFIVTAALLFLLNFTGKGSCDLRGMKWYKALGVGAIQGIAILPGISRSGATIAGASYMGLKREAAAEFSFLLSVPAILGSLVLELPDAVRAGAGSIDWLSVAVGTLVAAVSGYFAVRLMIKLIVNRKLNVFAFYTLILGLLVLLDQFVFNLVFSNPFAA
ncbi:MAG: undecaprenyl-diphosphate phosphatase [Clostridia bacterium]|nr:undecaprenyl-diphosphate phosphatase [Clostridia bacterium]